MTWIDTTVVIVVVALMLFLIYRPLKEPINAFFALIGRGLVSLKDKVSEKKEIGGFDTIEYG